MIPVNNCSLDRIGNVQVYTARRKPMNRQSCPTGSHRCSTKVVAPASVVRPKSMTHGAPDPSTRGAVKMHRRSTRSARRSAVARPGPASTKRDCRRSCVPSRARRAARSRCPFRSPTCNTRPPTVEKVSAYGGFTPLPTTAVVVCAFVSVKSLNPGVAPQLCPARNAADSCPKRDGRLETGYPALPCPHLQARHYFGHATCGPGGVLLSPLSIWMCRPMPPRGYPMSGLP